MRHKMHQNEVFSQLAATALANPASMCHCLRKSTDMREIFSRDPWRSDHEEGMARPSRTEGIKSGTPARQEAILRCRDVHQVPNPHYWNGCLSCICSGRTNARTTSILRRVCDTMGRLSNRFNSTYVVPTTQIEVRLILIGDG
jgi:hypothetical protein